MSTTGTDRRSRHPQLQRDAAAGPVHLTARDLSPAGQALAADQLVCDLTLRRGLHDPYPQIICYRATFRLLLQDPGSTPGTRDSHDQNLGGYCPRDLHILHRLAPAFAEPRPAGSAHEIQVGSASVVVLPRWDQATFDALDDQSWDLAAFGCLLRHGYYEILSELRGTDPRTEPTIGPTIEPGVVLVDEARVLPPWRGLRLGLLGTGLALRELRHACAFAVLYPMQPGLGTHAERTACRCRLARYWSQLGFTHPHGHHVVLDLTTSDLDAGLNLLARTTGRVRSAQQQQHLQSTELSAFPTPNAHADEATED